MFVALAFWIWSHTRDDRKWGGILFGCAIFGGLLFHYYTVLCLVPFGLCEAFEWRPWRRPSAKLIGAVVAVAVATAVLAKQMFGANRYSATFWSKPSLYGLRMAFPELFPNGLFVVVAIIALLAFLPRKNAPMSRAERAGWFCLLIPFTGYILALVVTNAFVTRYFLGMVPGVAIAFACFIWRNFRYRRAVAGGAFAVLAAAGAYEQMTVVRHPESIDPFGQQTQTRQMLKLEETLRAEGKHVFLCSTGLLYMEVDYYSKHPEQYRLLVPSEKDLEVLNTVRYTLAMGRYYPFRFWSPEDLKQHARETALIQPSETTLQVLQGLGLQTRVRYKAPLEVAYLE
jgi:hypothetical protein